jgi:hypothetical protein
MKVGKKWGLVGAGGVNQSFVARMPALLGCLGPVKGSSLRVARRISNEFRAGYAIAGYSDLKSCECIWISVPEDSLDRVAVEIAREVCLRGKLVVVCGVLRDSPRLVLLRTAGAHVATLNCIPEWGEQVFVAEGHPAVLAATRKQLALDGRKLIELRPARKALYLSGVHMGAHLLIPWIAGAAESFRAAGLSRAEAARLVQALGTKALRSYGTAGERAWKQGESEPIAQAIDAAMDGISSVHPWLAALHREGAVALQGLARKRRSPAKAGRLPAKLVARRAS